MLKAKELLGCTKNGNREIMRTDHKADHCLDYNQDIHSS